MAHRMEELTGLHRRGTGRRRSHESHYPGVRSTTIRTWIEKSSFVWSFRVYETSGTCKSHSLLSL